VEIIDQAPPDGSAIVEDEFDGEKAKIGLEKRLI